VIYRTNTKDSVGNDNETNGDALLQPLMMMMMMMMMICVL